MTQTLSAQAVAALLKAAQTAIKYKDPKYNEYDELTDVELYYVNKGKDALMTYQLTADDKATFAFYEKNQNDPVVKKKVDDIQAKAKQTPEAYKQWEQYNIMWLGVHEGRSFDEIAEVLNVSKSYVMANYTKGDLMLFVPSNKRGTTFKK